MRKADVKTGTLVFKKANRDGTVLDGPYVIADDRLARGRYSSTSSSVQLNRLVLLEEDGLASEGPRSVIGLSALVLAEDVFRAQLAWETDRDGVPAGAREAADKAVEEAEQKLLQAAADGMTFYPEGVWVTGAQELVFRLPNVRVQVEDLPEDVRKLVDVLTEAALSRQELTEKAYSEPLTIPRRPNSRGLPEALYYCWLCNLAAFEAAKAQDGPGNEPPFPPV